MFVHYSLRSRMLAAGFLLSTLVHAPVASAATYNGEPMSLGEGTVTTYLTLKDDGGPLAIGIRMTESALRGLPEHPNNTSRCFDRNGDGKMEAPAECLGDYELAMSWPADIKRARLPFKWMGLDWNAHGHSPEHVYDKPHFDMHFYMIEEEWIRAIRSGPCGEHVNCEDFERARVPVPVRFMPAGYADVGAVVGEMGNHLVNTSAPELAADRAPFTHTLIYGAYDGHVIFMEPMVTREFLLSRPDVCTAIAQPRSWDKPGRYPTRYCIRYLPEESALTVSLEGFLFRRTALDAGVAEDASAMA